jgi:hypothetical protein
MVHLVSPSALIAGGLLRDDLAPRILAAARPRLVRDRLLAAVSASLAAQRRTYGGASLSLALRAVRGRQYVHPWRRRLLLRELRLAQQWATSADVAAAIAGDRP